MTRLFATVTLGLALLASACGGDDEPAAETGGAATSAGPSGLSATVDHPLIAFDSVRLAVFEGTEGDPDTGETVEIRVESEVLEETDTVAGEPVTVVLVKDFEDGELVEETRDYYAQDAEGAVWYMGEHVDDYEDGRIVGHDGQWFAGRRGAVAGLFMPVDPQVGQLFEQERAPGVAEDRSTVVDLGRRVTTPAGRFSGCIKTRDEAPLDRLVEFKFYCPGVGLVREVGQTGQSNLVSFRSG
jgi:hypothetical protein